MRIPRSLHRSRLSTGFRRVLGPAVAAARYPRMRLTSRRSFTAVVAPSQPAPTLALFDDAQLPSTGTGPGLHRRYRIDIAGARLSPSELIAELVADPNRFSPIEYATFGELRDPAEAVPLAVGDDVMVRISGPYDAPVRVVEIAEDAVRLQTRVGHIEAGQIRFAARQVGDVLRFEISSWSRSAGLDIHLLWWSGLAYELQTVMWTHVCRRAAVVGGGRGGPVHVRTETLPDDDVRLLGEVTDQVAAPTPMRQAVTTPEPTTPEPTPDTETPRA